MRQGTMTLLASLKIRNALFGRDGDDSLDGGGGADEIYGGAGKDLLTGGVDADTFSFEREDTGFGPASADVITDFKR